MLMLSNSCGWAWTAVRTVPLPLHPLRAAMLNVTADYDQLAHLVAEFLEQPTVDPAVREQFLQFLAVRATRSYPRLESALDWLLSIYKFVFPFLIISMVAKLSGATREAPPAAGGLAAEPGGDGGEEDASVPTPTGSQLALARLASQPSGASWSVAPPAPPVPAPSQQQLKQQQRQLAISRAISRAAKAPAADAGRGGSLSPRGPETPVEGLRGLPAHPAGAGSFRARPQQRTASSEILEGGL
ncbi:Heat shock 83-1 [Chlorella sorokiniana]|uniref:Heat shock 83-1 n=1 Tax=Chlorella sorokiniana TaxID=3076 RepID=A0A2P6TCN7_CHLSO|nr:Heat shock 83-1 [Chlorella sorokiniana]|eukprot:PRW20410.1 Heat shock 83-1 [Chlorella sorokiniana]